MQLSFGIPNGGKGFQSNPKVFRHFFLRTNILGISGIRRGEGRQSSKKLGHFLPTHWVKYDEEKGGKSSKNLTSEKSVPKFPKFLEGGGAVAGGWTCFGRIPKESCIFLGKLPYLHLVTRDFFCICDSTHTC